MSDPIVIRYPSGAPYPTYGPSTEDEIVTDALEWAYAMLLARDEMNAAVHCNPVRLSPITTQARTALGIWRARSEGERQ
jgi:hypothetical protein